jgi:hypothetical protein
LSRSICNPVMHDTFFFSDFFIKKYYVRNSNRDDRLETHSKSIISDLEK